MSRSLLPRLVCLAAVTALLVLCVRWLLPLAMPFLLGAALAFAAEPAVKFGTEKLRLKRWLCSGIFVSGTLILLLSLLVILGSLLFRQLGNLARAMPDLESAARQGLTTLEDLLLGLAYRAPEGIRPLLTKSVLGLFGTGNEAVERLARQLPAVATSVLSHVPDGALTLFTAVLSAFMLSARLPKLQQWLKEKPLSAPLSRLLPAVRKVGSALVGWLKAQLKLSGMSFLVLLAGLWLLGVRYAPVWALLIALVDAVPLLGTGTALVPWSIVCFLQGDHLRGAGLLGIYAVAALTRSVLEPRLVGKQLGLDPLLTLAALYAGYRFWGIGGMLLAPVLSVAARELTVTEP